MVEKYRIVYADPAWVYDDKALSGNRGAECHYNCTSTEDMGDIELNAADDSVCLMWCTYPMLEEGLKLMRLWGFEFKTVLFTWVKKNKSGQGFFFGMGRYTRGNPEIVLLGKRGKGVSRIDAGVPNLQIHKVGRHSEKPAVFRELVVKLFGDLPRVELFSRTKVEGWDACGNEVPDLEQRRLV